MASRLDRSDQTRLTDGDDIDNNATCSGGRKCPDESTEIKNSISRKRSSVASGMAFKQYRPSWTSRVLAMLFVVEDFTSGLERSERCRSIDELIVELGVKTTSF